MKSHDGLSVGFNGDLNAMLSYMLEMPRPLRSRGVIRPFEVAGVRLGSRIPDALRGMTVADVLQEYGLILQKKSNLSRRERDMVSRRVQQLLRGEG